MIDNFQLASWKIWSCKGALCNGNKKNCSWDYIGSIAGLYGVFDLFHSNRPIRRTWYYACPCCYRWIYCIRAGQAKRKITSSLWNYRVYGFQIPYALFLYLISEKMQKSNVTSFLRVALKKTRNKSIVLMLFTTWWAAWSYLGLCRYLSWGNWRKSFICLHQ